MKSVDQQFSVPVESGNLQYTWLENYDENIIWNNNSDLPFADQSKNTS